MSDSLILPAIIICFMQGGFALIESGTTRCKNATHLLAKNFFITFTAAICYWLIGYGLAFGSELTWNNPFCGTMYFAHHNMPDRRLPHWLYHMTYAATVANIVAGALAERCDFVVHLAYTFFLTVFTYPVVTHWTWDPSGSGWLMIGSENQGYKDFAGSGVVHLLAGVTALVGALILGRRKGYYHDLEKSYTFRGHSKPLIAIGGFILFFGFLAFNQYGHGLHGLVVNQLTYTYTYRLASPVINTVIAAAFSAFTTLVINLILWRVRKRHHYRWSMLCVVNSSLAGMVAVAAGCDVYYTWAAMVVGIVAALSYLLWSWIVRKAKIDDPVDAFAVHAGGGLWGVLAAPLLRPGGIFLNWGRLPFLHWAWNIAGAVVIIVWAAVLAAIVFGILRLAKCIRLKSFDIDGLDNYWHREPAYQYDMSSFYEDGYRTGDLNGKVVVKDRDFDISGPRLDVRPPSVDLKGPRLDKVTDVEVKRPVVEAKPLSDVDIRRTYEVETRGPEVEVSPPYVDTRVRDVVEVNRGPSYVEAPTLEINRSAHGREADVELRRPAVETRVSDGYVDTRVPSVEVRRSVEVPSMEVRRTVPDVEIRRPVVETRVARAPEYDGVRVSDREVIRVTDPDVRRGHVYDDRDKVIVTSRGSHGARYVDSEDVDGRTRVDRPYSVTRVVMPNDDTARYTYTNRAYSSDASRI